jgi:hypothetical protein
LIEHVEGRRDMSSTQVTAGLGLLKKCLPDLQSVELSGDAEKPVAVNVSDLDRGRALAFILRKAMNAKDETDA